MLVKKHRQMFVLGAVKLECMCRGQTYCIRSAQVYLEDLKSGDDTTVTV